MADVAADPIPDSTPVTKTTPQWEAKSVRLSNKPATAASNLTRDMRAEIISIGTELLLGQITDTNAATLGEFLARQGITHTHRQTVGDNLPRIVEAIQLALTRAEIVFTIGDLAPPRRSHPTRHCSINRRRIDSG
ncbi:hypothetical protein CCB80_00080 [Armatimonadetes bacterium Uphvl-Ar1]|nr:hypothetical protein CCB80_00080 [Armatimonadetes bacterium Uphvl-Ar1]